jgi:lipopolysaccharide/colanic/teichoic acid biosynthesis glycosyltransferase
LSEFERGYIMYAKFFKRLLDIVLSVTALIVLSPVLIILTVVGAVA